jgi:hypothetical protein
MFGLMQNRFRASLQSRERISAAARVSRRENQASIFARNSDRASASAIRVRFAGSCRPVASGSVVGTDMVLFFIGGKLESSDAIYAGRAHGEKFTHCWRCSDVLKCRSSWAADDRTGHGQQR